MNLPPPHYCRVHDENYPHFQKSEVETAVMDALGLSSLDVNQFCIARLRFLHLAEISRQCLRGVLLRHYVWWGVGDSRIPRGPVRLLGYQGRM